MISLITGITNTLKKNIYQYSSSIRETKSRTTLYRFGILCLYIVDCFCHILIDNIPKDFLLHSKLFKLEVDFTVNISTKILEVTLS